MIKLSVIVPVYNAVDYISRCLDSLINQSLDDMEIIVIDDGSNDGTHDMLLKYKNKIKLIEQANSGVASARNRGISCANGQYIAFVDSDDWIDKDMFYKMYNKAIENDYDCVMCNYWYVDDKKKWEGVTTSYHDIITADDKKRFMVKMFPVIWNKIYKKDKIKQFKFKDGVWAEDVEFLYRIITNIDNIGVINDRLYYYYQREVSESRLYDKRIYDYIDNFNGIVKYYRDNNYFDIYKNELEYCYVRYLYATFVKRATFFQDKNSYKIAIDTAICNVRKNFPKYRKNKYFYRSLKGLYLLFFNKFLASIYYRFRNIK